MKGKKIIGVDFAYEVKPKPRLSMKLLWKMYLAFKKENFNTYRVEEQDDIKDFLDFVEEQMKPLKT